MGKNLLVELGGVAKSFKAADGTDRTVLDRVDFQLAEGEIVALLGKSGSGKSTLLRIMAGLIPADHGQVSYRQKLIYGPVAGIAMVFQSFALFPWLTVQQNVELGLEAQGVAPDERAKRADAVLEMIGLAGFGGALPRELSGGMKQRVGIARALVTNPDILLMGEAFSALDVLTGETLRNDMLELWDGVKVRALIDEVYGLMTMRPEQEVAPGMPTTSHLGYRLPETDITRIEGVLDLLADAPFDGHADLPQLAQESELADEELFPTYEALGMLGLAHVDKGDIMLTALGRNYVEADQAQKQEFFGQQLLTHVPLAAHIRRSLEDESSGTLSEKRFLDLLEEFMEADEAKRVLEVAIEWGRYGEVYSYDFHTGQLTLPEQSEG